MKAVVAAFNQEKALVGAFSVITNLRIELFQALVVMMMVMMQVDTLEIALHEMMDIVDIIFLVEATKTHKGVG